MSLAEQAGVAYIVISTFFGLWQLRQNRKNKDTAKSRQERDDLVDLLKTKLEFAESEISLLKQRVNLQQAQIDALSKLPFDQLHAEHATIIAKLGGSTG